MAADGLTHQGTTADGHPCAVVYLEPGAVLEVTVVGI